MSKKSFKLSEIAKFLDGELYGEPSKKIFEINPLDNAEEGSISFIYNKKFLKQLKNTSASAVLLSKEFKDFCGKDCIVVKDSHLSYALLTKLFSNDLRKNIPQDLSMKLKDKDDIQIAKNVFIGEDVKIGKGVIINPGCFIGNNVEIGPGTFIHPNVSIYHETILGKNNIIHSNSVLGSDGLGFAKNSDSWEKIEHIGNLELEDNVEIGATCTIDRGSLGSTKIGKGVKLDNQVHIAHNCKIGEYTIIGAKTAVAGSTIIGDECLIGGGCGIVDNIKIASKVRVNPMTYVTKSIKTAGVYSGGSVVLEHSKWLKHIIMQKKKFDD